MKMYAIQTVRNEADIITANVRHHLSLGLDGMLIVDNGSSDGTASRLRRLARDPRVRVRFDGGMFRQADSLTELAREAAREGADWVMSVDADEFWQPTGGDLRSILEATSAGALEVEVVNFIQRRQQSTASPRGLLHATRRAAQTTPRQLSRERVEQGLNGFVEIGYPPKLISRTTPTMGFLAGAHGVTGVPGHIEHTDAIVCLHVPLRSRSILASKAEQGRRVEEAGCRPDDAWHVRRWRWMRDRELDDEWAANSYRDEMLDVYGQPHPVVVDTRLRDAVVPWLAPSLSRRLGRLLARRT